MDKDIALLHKKIDYLTEYIEAQRKKQQAFDEFKQDLIPIANQMIHLSIEELAEIGTDFELEDLLFLTKRLLRNTRQLVAMLDRLEAVMDLGDEAQVIGKQAFANIVETLDRLEHEGYFAFARGGWQIIERIVAEFSEDDVQALGDNIVTILTTVRNMTQPKVLALADSAIGSISQELPGNGKTPSTWALLRELSDPKVRRGLARLLNLVKALADQPS